MRVVIVARGTQGPGVVGGVQAYLRRITSGLKSIGHEVVFELAGETPGANLARAHKGPSEALGAALQRDPDVVQITFGLPARTVARHARALRGVEHRLSGHFNHPPRASAPGLMKDAPEPLFRVGYWATYTGSLVPSPRIGAALEPWGRPVLVPPPATLDHFDIDRSHREGPIRFGFAGRIDIDKGVGDLVAAFDSLAKRFGDTVELEVLGQARTSDASFLERRRHLRLTRLDPTPRWSPQRSREMLEFLERIDVLVLPYRALSGHLDIPETVVEGMAAGCALVTTGLGDIPWIVGPNGPSVPVGDAAALRDVLTTFVERPEDARKLGLSLRQRAREWDLTPVGAAQRYVKGLG